MLPVNTYLTDGAAAPPHQKEADEVVQCHPACLLDDVFWVRSTGRRDYVSRFGNASACLFLDLFDFRLHLYLGKRDR